MSHKTDGFKHSFSTGNEELIQMEKGNVQITFGKGFGQKKGKDGGGKSIEGTKERRIVRDIRFGDTRTKN